MENALHNNTSLYDDDDADVSEFISRVCQHSILKYLLGETEFFIHDPLRLIDIIISTTFPGLYSWSFVQ